MVLEGRGLTLADATADDGTLVVDATSTEAAPFTLRGETIVVLDFQPGRGGQDSSEEISCIRCQRPAFPRSR